MRIPAGTSNTVLRPISGESIPLAVVGAFAAVQYVVWRGETTWAPQLWLLIIAIALVLRGEWRTARRISTPTGLCASTMLVLFWFRPVIASATLTTNAGAAIDARPLDEFLRQDGRQAIFQAVLFVCALGIASGLGRGRGDESAPPVEHEADPVARTARARTIALACAGVAVVADLLLVSRGGSLSGYFSGLSNRSSFLSGSSYLTLAYVPLLVGTAHYAICRARVPKQRRGSRLVLMSLILLLIVTTVITGGRAQLLLGCIVPLVLIKQYGARPLRWWWMAALVTVTVVAALIMGLLLRDNQFTSGATYADLKSSPFQTLGNRITSGIETRPFDSVLRLDEGLRDGEVHYEHGSTYLTVFDSFIPRSLWAGKPYGGGNTWFTSNLLPRFYGPERVETSLSAVGEAFGNFGYPGVLVVGALVGFGAARLDRRRRRAGVDATTLVVSVTPILVSFIRSDAYHNVSLALFTFVLARVICTASRPPARRPTAGTATAQKRLANAGAER